MKLTKEEQIKIHKDFSKGRLETSYDEHNCRIIVDSVGYDIIAAYDLDLPLKEIKGRLVKGDYLTPDSSIGSSSIEEQIEDIIIGKIDEFERIDS